MRWDGHAWKAAAVSGPSRAPWMESWKLWGTIAAAARQALSMKAARCGETMPATASAVPASWLPMLRSSSWSRSMRVLRPGRSTSMSVLMRCFQRAARIVPPSRCGECWSGRSRAVSRERCGASGPTGRLRVLEASGVSWAVRARRRCLEGVDLPEPRSGGKAPWSRAARASCRPGEGAFRVGG